MFVTQRAAATRGNVDAGTVKIMLDGCPENGTSAMLAPFSGRVGEAHGTGISFVEATQLAEALTQLEREEPQKAELVKLRFFAGLSLEESAEALGISPATAKRRPSWRPRAGRADRRWPS